MFVAEFCGRWRDLFMASAVSMTRIYRFHTNNIVNILRACDIDGDDDFSYEVVRIRLSVVKYSNLNGAKF